MELPILIDCDGVISNFDKMFLGVLKNEFGIDFNFDEAEEWDFLGRYPVMANRGGGAGYLYLARGARFVAEPHSDDLEEQEILFLDFDEVEAAIATGSFNVITWTTCVALALLHLKAYS